MNPEVLKKVQAVANSLGVSGKGQATTRSIFHRKSTQYGAVGTVREIFFGDIAGTAFPNANIKNNKLDVAEFLVIKEISMNLEQALNNGGTGLVHGYLNFYVGNQRVIKELPLDQIANQDALALSYEPLIGRGNSTGQMVGQRLLTNIVIPPQTEFYLEIVATNQVIAAAPQNAIVEMGGFGVLFNPEKTF